MMKNELIQRNINNLTQVWEAMTIPHTPIIEKEDYKLSLIEGSNLPNRAWFELNATPQPEQLNEIYQSAQSHKTPLIIPFWNTISNETRAQLQKHGWQTMFHQTAMAMSLDKTIEKPSQRFSFELVDTKEKAALCATTGSKAFGYTISPEVFEKSYDDQHLEYWNIFEGDTPVGTGILATFEDVAGIHLIGVAPEFRRRGIAKEMMLFILNRAQDLGLKYSTLQASAAGQPLYEKLGYETQFVIENVVTQLELD